MVMGDSLAAGVSLYARECAKVVQTGISSGKFLNDYNPFRVANNVIISLGSNDVRGTEMNLVTLRENQKGANVTWILPMKDGEAREAVLRVARHFKDRVIDSRNAGKSRDGVHPPLSDYDKMAREWLSK